MTDGIAELIDKLDAEMRTEYWDSVPHPIVYDDGTVGLMYRDSHYRIARRDNAGV